MDGNNIPTLIFPLEFCHIRIQLPDLPGSRSFYVSISKSHRVFCCDRSNNIVISGYIILHFGLYWHEMTCESMGILFISRDFNRESLRFIPESIWENNYGNERYRQIWMAQGNVHLDHTWSRWIRCKSTLSS